jgi:signal transduction histidine kinase
MHPNVDIIRALGITAYAGQPLIAHGRLLGSLSFASTTRTSFTSDEAALLQATSDQVAIAIERAELTASLQQQTEKLTQANRIKDEFLAVLSHELRTPLNPILGWSRILQKGQCDKATTTRALETIERNARIQTQLIDDLLNVSRILRGKLVLNSFQVNLVQIAEAALETVRLAAEAKRLNLRLEWAGEGNQENGEGEGGRAGREGNFLSPSSPLSPPTPTPIPSLPVLGDPSRLQQVVWNLLSNAVKFTPMDGRIILRISVITETEEDIEGEGGEQMLTVSNSSVAEYAQIQVIDTGKGINPEFLPYVFDYFRQADGSTTRVFGGLGLGLAIAQHIVQAHGGTLTAYSRGEGQGATFTVRLPLSKDENQGLKSESLADSSSPSHRSSLPFRGLRILVVDDERDTLDLIAFLLEQRGARVATATSVSEALSTLESFKPSILVSDIGMPKQDGYSLLEKIQSLRLEGNNIPAIALSAYARDEDRAQALKAGFQKYISKPVDPFDFIATIAELAGREL